MEENQDMNLEQQEEQQEQETKTYSQEEVVRRFCFKTA